MLRNLIRKTKEVQAESVVEDMPFDRREWIRLPSHIDIDEAHLIRDKKG